MHVAEGGGAPPLAAGMLSGSPTSLETRSAAAVAIGGSQPPQEAACRFPKLEECAHFHYERVQLPAHVQVTLQPHVERSLHSLHHAGDVHEYMVQVTSGDECWLLQRSLENFHMLDAQLHQCIYDRQVSQLPELAGDGDDEAVLVRYLQRLSGLADNSINCGPVLNWLQMDNRGHRLLVPSEQSRSINTPAVAAAYGVRRYVSQARDELSLEVGDMISVIDMAAPGESLWWRGKRGFQVGFFPQHCVHIIGDKVPRHMPLPAPLAAAAAGDAHQARQPPEVVAIKPVLRAHGKLIAFFRSFLLNRPSRRRLRQSGILRERVFGCDLGEHLLNTGCDVPAVLRCCAAFIEARGLVHGIYRLSGAASTIQRLRHAFDEGRVPDLHADDVLQDIHSVASLLKMYFRELPNPLCTHQLYARFVRAVHGGERLLQMRDAVRNLPPPHYRTLAYVVRHLATVAAHADRTGMTVRNVAIVWAPNLLRCADLEFGGGVAALQGVGVQAVVTEFLICHADLIFCDRLDGAAVPQSPPPRLRRPSSLAVSTPTRLITLEEARSKQLSKEPAPAGYIDVGGGPGALPTRYHTVIELPAAVRKRVASKRSPLGWRSLFGRSRPTCPPTATAPAKSVELLSVDLEQVVAPTPAPRPVAGHSRSVSHDSYFDGSLLDIAEIQVNFALEEAEMRIFSEDESLVSSPRVQPRRARAASGGRHPSPKKQARRVLLSPEAASRKRTRLEEQLGDMQFIDCSTPEMGQVDAPRSKSPRSSQCMPPADEDDDGALMMTPTPPSPTYRLLESSAPSSPGDRTPPAVLTTISITYKSPAKAAIVQTEDAQIPTAAASLPLQAAKLQLHDDDDGEEDVDEAVDDEEEEEEDEKPEEAAEQEDGDGFPTCDTTLSELIDSYDRIAKATSGDAVHAYENVRFEVSQEKRKSSAGECADDADRDVYQQVKYFRRSVHEVNELLEAATAPAPCDSLDAVCEEPIEFVGDSLEAAPGGASPSDATLSEGPGMDDASGASVRRLTSRFEDGGSSRTPQPPCVRARNCKSSLKALTRSLDESEFEAVAGVQRQRRNSMDESALPKSLNQPKQLPEDPALQQHVVAHDAGLSRERIERYKEERRRYLHDKYRSESFRADKDALLSRFKALKPAQPAVDAVANGVRARTAIFEPPGDVAQQPPPPLRKDKLAASYCIKDMKALFEAKSQQ